MYTVKELSGRGRGVVAARLIKAGETIIEEAPLLLTVAQDAKDYACAHCMRLLSPLGAMACQLCRQAAFCSTSCATAAAAKPWVHADATCRAYVTLGSAPLDDDGRSALRFLIQAMALRALAARDPADGRYATLLELQGAPNSEALQQAATLRPLLATAIGDPACLGAGVEELAGLLRREQLNSYGIMAPPGPGGDRRVRGGGIYPCCSLVNHECAPNAVRFDEFDAPAAAPLAGAAAAAAVPALDGGYPPSTRVRIRAMHDLPAGTEVVQSYFPLNWPLAERRRQARDVYGFDCACPRCLTEEAPGWEHGDGRGGSSSSGWETDQGDAEGEDGEEKGCSGEDAMEHEGSGAGGSGGEQEPAAAAGPASSSKQGGDDSGVGGGSSSDDRGLLDPTYLQLFLLKYLCPREGCFGTMAAVPGGDGDGGGGGGGRGACECNVCGVLRTDAEFLAELEASQ